MWYKNYLAPITPKYMKKILVCRNNEDKIIQRRASLLIWLCGAFANPRGFTSSHTKRLRREKVILLR
jgi:hypothetical protein